MPERKFDAGSEYRYGFNGKELDNELVQYDYGFRIYDPRLVKFKSIDPLADEFPWYSPYHFAGNSPIQNLDIDGQEEVHYVFVWTDNIEKPVIKLAAWQVGTQTGEVNHNGQAIFDVPFKIIAHYPVEFGDEVYFVSAEYASEEALLNAKAKDFTGSVISLGTLLGFQLGDEVFDNVAMLVGLGSFKKNIKLAVKEAIEAANTLAIKEVKQLNKQIVDKLEKKLVTQSSEKAGDQAVKVELKDAKSTTKKSAKEGVIYKVPGDKTPSGKPYVGSADDLKKRAKTAKDGRNRDGAAVIGKYPKGDQVLRRKTEQQAINNNGGKRALDNKRDEIKQKDWKKKGVKPPK